MSVHPRYSIIIPAYNEERRLQKSLPEISAFFGDRGDDYEIIIVDDGSRDGTYQQALQFAPRKGRMRVLHNGRNRGKGASIRRGVAAARGEFLLFTDADLSTPIREFAHLVKAVERGAQVAIGSRAIRGAYVPEPQPLYRTLMGKLFNLLVRIVVLPGIHDTQCGFKLFTRIAARKIFRQLTIPRFGFDVEILYLARQAAFRITEVPVEWRNSPASTVSPLKDSTQMFLDLFRIRQRHR